MIYSFCIRRLIDLNWHSIQFDVIWKWGWMKDHNQFITQSPLITHHVEPQSMLTLPITFRSNHTTWCDPAKLNWKISIHHKAQGTWQKIWRLDRKTAGRICFSELCHFQLVFYLKKGWQCSPSTNLLRRALAQGAVGSVWGRLDRTERSHLKFPHVLTFINFHVKLVWKAHMRK